MSETSDLKFIPDLPRGPLDEYRRMAPGVNWKNLKIFLEGEEAVRVKYRTYKIMESHAIFDKEKNPSSDEQKRIAAVQLMAIKDLNMYPAEVYSLDFRPRYRFLMAVNECLHAYSPSLAVKISLSVGLFQNGLLAMGTKKHMEYYTKAWTREIVSCLAITEISHGSNTKQIRTTATYDKETQEFVINTPDFEAAKCWVGNLGKTATIALLFAKLITPDGYDHGLHGFLVKIRDENTLKAYPGILVGDMGEKIGLHGIDNGFIMFDNYRIPRDNLLNRTSDVSPEGEYQSLFSEPNKILGAALESLMTGRIGICRESMGTLSSSAVIATRYAAMRKQFTEEKGGAEVPIIEYQLHQWRIFPYLAAACVLKVATHNLTEAYYDVIEHSHKENEDFEELSKRVAELHALVSTFKPLCTWTARDSVQEAREACGGHGYLKAASLGELRANNDPAVTYEGDNNVLGQQTSKWLLKQWIDNDVQGPLGTCDFMKDREKIFGLSYDNLKNYGVNSFKFYELAYEWLMCHLLHSIDEQFNAERKLGYNTVAARNRTQVYRASVLVKAYGEYYALKSFHAKLLNEGSSLRDMEDCLLIIYRIYAQFSLEKHLIYFYEGGFTRGPEMLSAIRNSLLENCNLLKKYSVTVSDALAPPDFILNSVIAKADGNLYKNLQTELMTSQGAMERASWWKDVLPVKKSKL